MTLSTYNSDDGSGPSDSGPGIGNETGGGEAVGSGVGGGETGGGSASSGPTRNRGMNPTLFL